MNTGLADEELQKLERIYAAVGATMESNLEKFPAELYRSGSRVIISQNFRGGRSDAELSNIAHMAIHNVAALKDYLKQWLRRRSQGQNDVERFVRTSPALQTVLDLWNVDKHGYPLQRSTHTGRQPRLSTIRSSLRVSTGETSGSTAAWVMGQGIVGSPGASGKVIVSGAIVDSDGSAMGELSDVLEAAVRDWTTFLRAKGTTV